MPTGLNDEELERIDALIGTRRKIKRGEAIFLTVINLPIFSPYEPVFSKPVLFQRMDVIK